jgi:hypothetical protein
LIYDILLAFGTTSHHWSVVKVRFRTWNFKSLELHFPVPWAESTETLRTVTCEPRTGNGELNYPNAIGALRHWSGIPKASTSPTASSRISAQRRVICFVIAFDFFADMKPFSKNHPLSFSRW